MSTAILLQGHPLDRETINQPARRIEEWHYPDGVAGPGAVGSVDGDLFIVGRVKRPAPNGDGYYWTLEKSTSLDIDGANPGVGKDDGDPYYTADDSGIDVPISRHPDYLANWDHDLIASYEDGETKPSAPGFWATATTTEISGADSETYQWTQADFPAHEYDAEGKKIYWFRLKSRTKPGVEAFKAPGLRVTEIKYYTNENDAGLNIGATIGTKAKPAKLYGGPDDDDKWLIVAMRSYPDGSRWAVQKEYQTAGYIDGAWQNWDTDLYLPAIPAEPPE